jgi:elongation factor 1-alpha
MSQVFKVFEKSKPSKHLVCIGHLDHGKSTLLGRIFYDLERVDQDVMKRIEKYAEAFGQKTFDFAYIMDFLKEERSRGITIHLGHKKLETDQTSFTFGDAPGHHDFLKNMLVGAAESDAAILVVAADEGVQRQTEEHLFLAKMLGLPSVIIAINKIDLVDYQKPAFEQVKKQVVKLLKKVGYFPEEVPLIPTSALLGDNVVKKSKKLSWFKGPTILEAMENLPPRKIPSDLPLRLPIQDLYQLDKPVVIGRLVSGQLKEGDQVVVYPQKKKLAIEKMYLHDKQVKKADPEDNLYLYLEGIEKAKIKRGQIVADEKSPPPITQKFKAQVVAFGVPNNVQKGFRATFEMSTEETPCQVERVIRKIDTVSGETLKGQELGDHEAGEVLLATEEPIFIEAQNELPHLAGFRLKLKEKVIALGVCTEVL